MQRRRSIAWLGALLALSTHPWRDAAAQTGASARITRILVGFPPGQATEGRASGRRAPPDRARLVENKPGRGGSLALAQLAKSPPDASLLSLLALAAYVVNPTLYRNVSYDSVKDFDPVALVADLPLTLVVDPSVPATTLKELVDHVKANPDKLSHSSVRQRHVVAPADGGPEVPHRDARAARAVPGQPARDGRPDGRQRADRLRHRDRDAAAGQGRQAAHDRRGLARPTAGVPRHADARRTRPSGFRGGRLDRSHGAGRHAA